MYLIKIIAYVTISHTKPTLAMHLEFNWNYTVRMSSSKN